MGLRVMIRKKYALLRRNAQENGRLGTQRLVTVSTSPRRLRSVLSRAVQLSQMGHLLEK